MRARLVRLLLASLLGTFATTSTAQVVDVLPYRAVPGEPLALRYYDYVGFSFTGYQLARAELVGNVIVIEGCIGSGGFSVGSGYGRIVPLPGLPAGIYRIEVYRAACELPPPPSVIWTLRGSKDFVIDASNAGRDDNRTVLVAAEYRNPTTNDYFLTTDEREMVALAHGTVPGWSPTYQFISLEPLSGVGEPICRFFSDRFPGRAPHFYTADPGECDALKRNALWTFEGIVGRLASPGAGATCPEGLSPLYRAYNNGQGGAPSHRYRVGSPLMDMVMYQGWVDEGVVGCVPAQ